MQEAKRQGISRRIAAVPKGFKVGETWVFLAHRSVPNARHADKGTVVEPRPAVFTAFRPTAIEYIVKGDESDEQLTRLSKQGLTLVHVKHSGELELPV